MSRIQASAIGRSIREKRSQLQNLREEIEDLSDYLDVLEARARDLGKARLSHAEIKRRYGLGQGRARNGRRAA
jgi:chromosome segregation ATPase